MMFKSAFRSAGLNQVVRIALGPLVLVLVPIFLTAEQQGYWFAMISLAAIMAFADMGLSTAVMQHAAHEHASLQQARERNSDDYHYYRERLDTLLSYAIRRAIGVAAITLPGVFIAGLLMFGRGGEASDSGLAWGFFCIASAASFSLNIIFSCLEGRDGVARIQRKRALVTLATLGLTVSGLVMGLGLWTLPLASGVATLTGFLWVMEEVTSAAPTLTRMRSEQVRAWSRELKPLLTKYTLSWIGGYLMFQLFSPLVLRLEGPIAAGKVGLTISAFTAIFALSNTWSTYQIPAFSMAVAVRDRRKLEDCLFSSLAGSMFSYLCLTAAAIGAWLLIRTYYPSIAARFLDAFSIGVLALIWFLQLIVHNLAIYLRAFKDDPLVWPTVFAAAYTVTITVALLHFFGLTYLFVGLLTSYVWLVPVVLWVFHKQRNATLDWHPVNVGAAG